MSHYPVHLITGAVALAAALAISSLTINRLVKRKLRLSIFLFGAYVLLNLVVAMSPRLLPLADPDLRALEGLALIAGIINLLVICVINPLAADRVPDRFPTIVQDGIVIGLVLLIGTLFFNDRLFTTSAISAVVLGFALQDTLGNAFAGLAIQSEKPFHVGHWIRVGEFEGRVAEITWRATKLRTKSGNFVIVPNNIVSKEAITNYSEPVTPTRIQVEVGASYLSAPNLVKAAIFEAMSNAPRVLEAPAPDVLLVNFDNSAITYRARFWIDDYERDEAARDQVRTAIYYAFARHGIEIPYPIQVEYARAWPEPDAAVRIGEREQLLGAIDLFAPLTAEQRREIAAATATRLYGDGEAIVREGHPGHSMFVVCSGRAVVTIEPEGRQVATIEAGGHFGEMSLLTGEPRSANVMARGDTMVIEIDAEQFRRLGATHPQAIEQVAMAAAARRAETDDVRARGQVVAVATARATFIDRMRRFLRL